MLHNSFSSRTDYLDEELDSFDVTAHYTKTLEEIARKADREAQEAREIVSQLTEEAIA